MLPEQKIRIDNMGYEEMLSLWRFAPAGHQMFAGDTGDYFAVKMKEKREAVGGDAHVAASKSIGWSK